MDFSQSVSKKYWYDRDLLSEGECSNIQK